MVTFVFNSKFFLSKFKKTEEKQVCINDKNELGYMELKWVTVEIDGKSIIANSHTQITTWLDEWRNNNVCEQGIGKPNKENKIN